MPIVTLDSLMSFNDVSFGFVPHGGSSYYLSRLPNEIGTFLCLTGIPIMGEDAMDFTIAEKLIHNTEEYEK
jgi:enoyl-CoA hydratase/carnithine racemase